MSVATTASIEEMFACNLVLDALHSNFPQVVTLGPASLGIDSLGDTVLRVLHRLSNDGLMTYEALRVRGSNIEIVDASLTPRGRSLLVQAA